MRSRGGGRSSIFRAAGVCTSGSEDEVCIVVKGRGGYASVFALAEFDPGFTDRVVLLAGQRDGNTLGTVEGPLLSIIIVPGEKRHAHWRQANHPDRTADGTISELCVVPFHLPTRFLLRTTQSRQACPSKTH
jgi:hypothetical protein